MIFSLKIPDFSRKRGKPLYFLFAALILIQAACVKKESGQAEIFWDTWGVPHIFADNPRDVFHAFGWAQMKSHGNLILKLYGQARGRAAEYWGKVYVQADRTNRTLGITRVAEEWYGAQKKTFKTYLDSFAEGLNAYAETHPDKIADDLKIVLPMTGIDVLAHTLRVFHQGFIGGSDLSRAQRWRMEGSNAWAIAPSKSAGGRAMLLANPHLPWSDFFLFYEAQLKTPDLDAYGATLVGMPTLAIAFNDHLGWTHTVNTFDGVDLYELTLTENGYLFDGQERNFETEDIFLKVKQADGTLTEEVLTVKHSVHGPVLAQRGRHAVAYRIVSLDQPHIWNQWWEMMHSTNLEEFEKAIKKMQIPMFNIIYADRDGHILYLFNGRVPQRKEGTWEYWKGILPGDSSENLWTETHPYRDLPRVIDPPSGWLQNTNDPPWSCTFPMALDPEQFPSYMSPKTIGFRPQRSIRMLREDEKVSFEELVEYKHSTHMGLADRLLDDLLPLAKTQRDELVLLAAQVLENWDRKADSESRGAVLFTTWVQKTGLGLFEEKWNEDSPLTTPDGLANPDIALKELKNAASQVLEYYGSLDVPWGDVYRLKYAGQDLPANGGPGYLGIFRVLGFAQIPNGRYIASSGDSFVAAVEFSDPVQAKVLLSYGNATQPDSPHRGDQLEMLSRKELRPAWRTREEIESHCEEKEVLHRGKNQPGSSGRQKDIRSQ